MACLVSFSSPISRRGGTVATGESLDLEWTDNADDETGYEIDRSLTGTGGWVNVTTTAANATTQTDTGLTEGITYYYRIKSINSAGGSIYDTANGTTTGG